MRSMLCILPVSATSSFLSSSFPVHRLFHQNKSLVFPFFSAFPAAVYVVLSSHHNVSPCAFAWPVRLSVSLLHSYAASTCLLFSLSSSPVGCLFSPAAVAVVSSPQSARFSGAVVSTASGHISFLHYLNGNPSSTPLQTCSTAAAAAAVRTAAFFSPAIPRAYFAVSAALFFSQLPTNVSYIHCCCSNSQSCFSARAAIGKNDLLRRSSFLSQPCFPPAASLPDLSTVSQPLPVFCLSPGVRTPHCLFSASRSAHFPGKCCSLVDNSSSCNKSSDSICFTRAFQYSRSSCGFQPVYNSGNWGVIGLRDLQNRRTTEPLRSSFWSSTYNLHREQTLQRRQLLIEDSVGAFGNLSDHKRNCADNSGVKSSLCNKWSEVPSFAVKKNNSMSAQYPAAARAATLMSSAAAAGFAVAAGNQATAGSRLSGNSSSQLYMPPYQRRGCADASTAAATAGNLGRFSGYSAGATGCYSPSSDRSSSSCSSGRSVCSTSKANGSAAVRDNRAAPAASGVQQRKSAAAVAEDTSALSRLLFDSMGSPDFNVHILSGENVLHFYGIRQATLRPVVREDCKKESGEAATQTGGRSSTNRRVNNIQPQFRCVLQWTLSHRREVATEGFGSSKKDAKKAAVKQLLAQLPPVTLNEYEQITKCMFASLRARIQAKQISFPGAVNEHRFMWTFMTNGQEVRIEAGGRGSSVAEAEVAAMQDMYLKVYKYKDVQVEERERLNREVTQGRQKQQAASSCATNLGATSGAAFSAADCGSLNKGTAASPLLLGACGLLPSQQQQQHLGKQDAGEINQQHHNVTTRNQIKTTENVVSSAEGYRCNLEWRWLGRDGKTRTLSCVGVGASKPLARANAAVQMMGQAGFLEPISQRDRQAARHILTLVNERADPKLYVSEACALLEKSSSAVWRLFLPTMWRSILAENDRSLVDPILQTLKKVTAPPPAQPQPPPQPLLLATTTTNTAGAGSSRSNACTNTTGSLVKLDRRAVGENMEASGCEAERGGGEKIEEKAREMPPDIWEQLLDEFTVLTNSDFGQPLLHELGELHLDQSYFPSPLARRYFQNFRLMLALEWQAQLATSIMDRKTYGDMFEGRYMILQCKSAVLPVFSLSTVLKVEDRDFLANVQFREDDCVLLRPYDEDTDESESWRKCFVGVVTTAKSDNLYFNVNVRLASGEGAKHPDVLTCRRFKLYYLTPAVTHDRMVQALRSLTMHRVPISQSASSYSFTSELRYMLLHTIDEQSKAVAARGPVPFLSDVDPALFDPLHLLNELADAQSSYCNRRDESGATSTLFHTKKQRLQQYNSSVSNSSLINQVGLQARQSLNRGNHSEHNEADYDDVKLPTDLPLNTAQRAACISALTNRLTLVQGPPGTGKTHVACAIIDAWQRNDCTKKILAVADSNVAADNLMEGLSLRGIRSVRVGNGSESDLQEEAIADLSRYRDYQRLKQKGMFGEAKAVRVTLFREAVRRHAVIIATCVGSGHEIFDDVIFSRVIIDEGAQSIEPSNLIPLGHGCRNFVLIGDHKQLPPTIISPEAAARGLDVSLLERFVESGISPIHLLDEQRRMHPSIAFFPNLQFYEGKIKNKDVDDCTRPPVAGFRWPSQHSRVCLIDIAAGGLSGLEMTQGTSKFSTVEIEPILAILRSVANEGTVMPSQIGVLTPYDAQKARLKRAINDSFGAPACYQIEVDSVDGFQGKEKDLILFSAVRSNARGEIGFLRDPRRMNVMLTRARRGAIVIADQLTLWNDLENWRPWIQWVGSMRSIVPVTRLNDHLDTPCYTLPSAAAVEAARGSAQCCSSSTSNNMQLKVSHAFVPQGFQCDFAAASEKGGSSAVVKKGGAAAAAATREKDSRTSSTEKKENRQYAQQLPRRDKTAEEEELERDKEDIPEDWEQLL